MTHSNWPANFPLHTYGTSVIHPSSYDESPTYYEQIAVLRKKMDEALKRGSSADKATQAIVDDLAAKINDLLSLWDQYRAHVEYLIQETQTAPIAWNPTKGTRHESINDVMDDVYDNVRVHALFASQFDELGLTSAEFDALGLTAREYDLNGAGAILNLDMNAAKDVDNG